MARGIHRFSERNESLGASEGLSPWLSVSIRDRRQLPAALALSHRLSEAYASTNFRSGETCAKSAEQKMPLWESIFALREKLTAEAQSSLRPKKSASNFFSTLRLCGFLLHDFVFSVRANGWLPLCSELARRDIHANDRLKYVLGQLIGATTSGIAQQHDTGVQLAADQHHRLIASRLAIVPARRPVARNHPTQPHGSMFRSRVEVFLKRQIQRLTKFIIRRIQIRLDEFHHISGGTPNSAGSGKRLKMPAVSDVEIRKMWLREPR